MRRAVSTFVVVLFCLSVQAGAELTPEAQLALTSLRAGERERLQKAAGPLDELPLYRAEFSVDPTAHEVVGTIAVLWFPKGKSADSLLLRVTPNAIRPGLVKLFHATVNGSPTLLEQPEPTLYRVKLDPVALPGTGALVEVHLTAKVPEASEGSDALSGDTSAMNEKKSDYGAFAAAPEVVNLTGLMPMVAPSRADGSLLPGPTGVGDFGTADPSLFLVSVAVPSGYAAVSGGNALGEVPGKDGKVRFSFGLAGARDFPLLVTKGYQTLTAQVDDITVESLCLPQDEATGQRVLAVARGALTEFQKRLGPYPLSSLRVVETRLTGGAGGMEFPGLVTVSTGLYRGTQDPLATLGLGGLGGTGMLKGLLPDLKGMLDQTLEFTVAHEVAHQYFAMLVGSDPIDEPVADEPLTQAMALLYLEWKHGRRAADHVRDSQLKLAFQFYRANGGRDGAADRPTADFATAGEYAALIYGKAPLLFEALRKQTGDAAYLKALRAYADEYRYRWARTDSFTRVLSLKAPGQAKAIEQLRRHWWNEAHGDEDLGESDLAQMLQGVMGGKASGPSPDLVMDPQTQKLLEEALKALGGQ